MSFSARGEIRLEIFHLSQMITNPEQTLRDVLQITIKTTLSTASLCDINSILGTR